jgi:hypothetical protein
MKNRLLIVISLMLPCGLCLAAPLGSAFTYQGRLTEAGVAATGAYDLKFSLYDSLGAGSQVGGALTNAATAVTNGLFTVTLDFGTVFDGNARWLQVAVRPSGGATFTNLSPRQPLSPAPYALYAPSAGAAATAATASGVAPNAVTTPAILNSNITAAKIASGQVVKSLNGLADSVTLSAGANVTLAADGNGLRISATPGTLVTNTGWGLSGNAGTGPTNFLGTTDGQPLEFRVSSNRVMRFEMNGSAGAPNVVGGARWNRVGAGVVGATIAGGGAENFLGLPYTNRIDADFGAIGGGVANLIQSGSYECVIAGGYFHTIQAGAPESVIGGGYLQTIQGGAFDSVIGGGYHNTIQSNAPLSLIGGGGENIIGPGAFRSTISGGYLNTNLGAESSIGGGYQNLIQEAGDDSVIAGGIGNQIGNYWATIGGGYHNRVNGVGGTVPGGQENAANGLNSFAAGTLAKADHDATFVWSDHYGPAFASTATDQFLVRAENGVGIGTNRPQARLDIAGRSWIDWPHLSLHEWLSTDFARLEFKAGTNHAWHIAAGSSANVMNFWNATANDNVMVLQTNGTLFVKVLTITGGADVSEPFEMSQAEIAKGAVVVIDREHPGRLKQSTEAYDKRVAGIVSGAGGVQPGLSLRQQGTLDGAHQVALSGRVYVQAEASTGAIEPGDLLTTSGVPGHAMKVTDFARAQGATLGKSMTPLREGRGLVLVLVTLQ